MQTTGKTLKALATLTSNNDTRPVLQAIQLKDGKLAATNGHLLLQVSTNLEGSSLIPKESVKALPAKSDIIKVSKSCVSTTSTDSSFLEVGGLYPDIESVIPESAPTISFDAVKMAKLCKAIIDIAGKDHEGQCKITASIPEDPRSGIRLDHINDLVAVLMPMHLM